MKSNEILKKISGFKNLNTYLFVTYAAIKT